MPPQSITDNTKLTSFYKRRVLFDKSYYALPDNYVDKTFLHDLQTNVNLKTYCLEDAIFNCTVITQELSSVSGCFALFVYLDEEWFPPGVLFISSTILVLILYFVCVADHSFHQWYGDGKQAFVFLAFILGLSPILKTLTHTVSTDSIYFMAGSLMMIHLITNNYGVNATIVKPALSLTAAIAASVTLASRLSTTFYVFEFLVFAVETFALFPLFKARLQKHIPWSKVPFTIFLVVSILIAVCVISPLLAFLLLCLEVFVNLICPLMFIHWQKYKNNIYGPWDEAVIPDS